MATIFKTFLTSKGVEQQLSVSDHPQQNGRAERFNRTLLEKEETMRHAVSQSVDLGQNNNPNTTPTKDYEKVRVVVYLRGVQRGCAEEGERGSTPTG